MVPQPAQRGGSAKSINELISVLNAPPPMPVLSRDGDRRTSALMTGELFDPELRMMRRDRAARVGPELFLLDHVLDDLVERLRPIRKSFERMLLVGCPSPAALDRFRFARTLDVVDPGPRFASAAGGTRADEDRMDLPVGRYDLIVSLGTLDTVNNLPDALLRLRLALGDDGFLIGAMAGGETLPALRSAMQAADRCMGAASPHVHPRIEPAALAGLIAAAGFVDPVVDIERVDVRYDSLGRLVRDLRAMAMTNILHARSRQPLSKAAWQSAQRAFSPDTGRQKVTERFEILHFAAWAGA